MSHTERTMNFTPTGKGWGPCEPCEPCQKLHRHNLVRPGVGILPVLPNSYTISFHGVMTAALARCARNHEAGVVFVSGSTDLPEEGLQGCQDNPFWVSKV